MDLIIWLILLLIALIVAFGVVFLSYWPMYGAPYVPTKGSEIEKIFKNINLHKGQIFCDLGCGDGRLVFEAVKITKAKAIGIDINWGLIQWCKTITFIRNIKNINFISQNIFENKLPIADVYFVYLWPGMIEKLAGKFEADKTGKIIVVSKSFEIKKWRKHLENSFVLNQNKFWVYNLLLQK